MEVRYADRGTSHTLLADPEILPDGGNHLIFKTAGRRPSHSRYSRRPANRTGHGPMIRSILLARAEAGRGIFGSFIPGAPLQCVLPDA